MEYILVQDAHDIRCCVDAEEEEEEEECESKRRNEVLLPSGVLS